MLQTKCIVDLGPLEEASGSIKVMKPNETSSCMLLGCGIIQFPISSLLDDIYYKSTSNNLTLCKGLGVCKFHLFQTVLFRAFSNC